MKLLPYFVVVLIATSLFSCKKDSTKKEDTKDCSLTEANFAGTYKIGTVKYKANASAPAIDATSMTDACSLDDLETFKSDHTLVYTDAGVKCDPAGDGTTTWSLNGKSLKAGSDSATVTAFDCTQFTISQPDFVVDGDSLIVTFQKQ